MPSVEYHFISDGFFLVRCDAEPGALADYILALLKHNVPESEMRKELTSQLEEFLESGTSALPCRSPLLTVTPRRVFRFQNADHSSKPSSPLSERNHIYLMHHLHHLNNLDKKAFRHPSTRLWRQPLVPLRNGPGNAARVRTDEMGGPEKVPG